MVELFGTWFGAFGSDTKMYKEFSINFNTNIEQIDLVFNRPRYDLSTTTEGVFLSEKIKGKLLSIFISIFGLIFFVAMIFLIVLLQIHFE